MFAFTRLYKAFVTNKTEIKYNSSTYHIWLTSYIDAGRIKIVSSIKSGYKLQYGHGRNVDTMTYCDITNNVFHTIDMEVTWPVLFSALYCAGTILTASTVFMLFSVVMRFYSGDPNLVKMQFNHYLSQELK